MNGDIVLGLVICVAVLNCATFICVVYQIVGRTSRARAGVTPRNVRLEIPDDSLAIKLHEMQNRRFGPAMVPAETWPVLKRRVTK